MRLSMTPDLPPTGKLLGLDLGTKTIGVAISDGMRYSATPLETIKRTKVHRGRRPPARTDRRERRPSPSSSACRSTWTAPRARAPSPPAPSPAISRRRPPLPILFWDERLSTTAVTRMLIEADTRRDKRAEVVDKLAASYILQGVLDDSAKDKSLMPPCPCPARWARPAPHSRTERNGQSDEHRFQAAFPPPQSPRHFPAQPVRNPRSARSRRGDDPDLAAAAEDPADAVAARPRSTCSSSPPPAPSRASRSPASGSARRSPTCRSRPRRSPRARR